MSEEKPPAPPTPPGLYTTREAAEYCGLAYTTFRKDLKRGHLAPDAQAGNVFLFTRETLDAHRAKPRERPGRRWPSEGPRRRKTRP